LIYDLTALKVRGNPRVAEQLQKAFKPGKTIFYSSGIEIEIANKGPLDYCLFSAKTKVILFKSKFKTHEAIQRFKESRKL